jgi:ribonuclease HI
LTQAPPLVAVYADESCLGNGREGENPGGAGVLIEYRRTDGELVRHDLWVSEPATTNNRMALRSVIEALGALGRKGRRLRVVFTTDSRYIVDGMNRWVHDWARRGWRRKGGAIENVALWQAAVTVARTHDLQWRWVRGHVGHAQNEYANFLAIRAAGTLDSSNGLVASGFDAWLATKPAMRPEEFPDPGEFVPAARLPDTSAASPTPGSLFTTGKEPP